MYYFVVATLKHLTTDRQLTVMSRIQEVVKKKSRYIIIKEYGKSGDSPHFNIIISIDKETTGKSFKQVVSRLYEGAELTDYTCKGKLIKNDVNLANVLTGYLAKEENAEVILNNGFDLEALEKIRQKQNTIHSQPTQVFTPLTASRFTDVVISTYNELYKPEKQPFNKDLYKKITKDIAKTNNIVNVIKSLNHIWLNLEVMLGNGYDFDKYIDRLLDNDGF